MWCSPQGDTAGGRLSYAGRSSGSWRGGQGGCPEGGARCHRWGDGMVEGMGRGSAPREWAKTAVLGGGLVKRPRWLKRSATITHSVGVEGAGGSCLAGARYLLVVLSWRACIPQRTCAHCALFTRARGTWMGGICGEERIFRGRRRAASLAAGWSSVAHDGRSRQI